MRVSNVTLRRRLYLVLLLGSVLFLALIARLAWVQLVMGPELTELAEESWRREVPFAASRGEIWDRNGERLAYNVSTPTIMAVPAQIKEKEATAKALAPVLGMTEKKVLETIGKRESIVRLQPGGRKITQDKAQQVRDLALPGIFVAEDNKRYYPYDGLAAHVLGFTGIDNQGLTGVEARYDELLKGIGGSVAYLSNARGEEMPGSSEEYIPPKDGLNLQLTIDKQIQTIMERELDQAMVKYQPKHIISIAVDPKTGEVLAMASRPGYEPGQYQQYDSAVYNRNLPIWMTYEPGSTFKIVTLAAALEEGKVSFAESFHDKGAIEVGGARLRCWKPGGHGAETFLEVVENSCNPGFVVMGQRLGAETLFDYIKKFGFGSKTGIDLGGEENGIMFKPERIGPVELATTAFGQGVSVTPIQQVMAVSAAINGGKLYKPHVGKAWVDPVTGDVVDEIEPTLVRENIISEATSKLVREALESVVAKGTGRNAFIEGYRVGGKTGTAQKVVNGRYSPTEHIVSFIGFAPADDPQIVVYTAVDNPKGLQFGGLIAAPIVQNIMEDSLRYMGVPPRKDQVEPEYRYGLDVMMAEVPDLVGRTTTEIYQSLNMNFTLAKYGAGNTVVMQEPKAGTKVPVGSTIQIYLSDQAAPPPSD
ncbi:stage V sporulation protein D [Paenibacillus antri]|uniref:Stage V sporulation protein D n=1 Tax=Paenibacillus antri TaxID=2582848 RepID=A0A5R9G222_9BACL|nr:stage V sporulation protein D [Paenibacillus antri]TLS50397.1 stage V sporulation protein D [Paenibacillus antri]